MRRKSYAFVWALWLSAYVIFEALSARIEPIWWVGLFLVFLALELHGVLDKRPGDTLSETVWAIERRGWGRRIFGVCLACAFGTRFMSLPFLLNGVMHDGVSLYLPWAFISGGLTGWLVVHFGALGKDG